MTHKERVLQLLSDHQPHTHMEGYRLGVMLHSRVADLRKEGHTISCWREGDDYLYQLIPTLGESAVSPVDAGPADSPNGTVREAQDIDGLRQPASLGSSPTPGTVPSETGISSHGGEAGSDPQSPPHQPSLFEAAA